MKARQLPIKLYLHYAKLLFYLRHRFEGNNYEQMREYFAEILISEIEQFTSLTGKKVLDVGGARGEFCYILHKLRTCRAINLDPNPGKPLWKNTVVASAQNLPFGNKLFDVVICRGVIEHIPSNLHQASINEMYRVTKKGGYTYLLVPMWYNLKSGHRIAPFHLLPFPLAKKLSTFFFHYQISGNSLSEEGLYPTTYGKTVQMIQESGYKIISTLDTHFRLHFLTYIPILRDIFVPDIAFILRRD